MAEKQQPGTKARLIREGLDRHPELAPQELAALLTDQHKALDIEFQSADVSLAKHILGPGGRKGDQGGTGQCSQLFSDRIPPMRERENPALQGFLSSHQDERPGVARVLTENDMQLLRDWFAKPDRHDA